MRGQEVSARAVVAYLEIAARRGIDRGPIVRGLGLEGLDLAARGARVSWEDYQAVLDRLQDAVGGAARFEDFIAETVTASRAMRTFAGCFVSATQLYLLMVERVSRMLYSCANVRSELLADGRVRHVGTSHPGYAYGLAFHHGSIGAMRAYPRFLGQPDAVVEADYAPTRSVYTVTPPDSQTLLARVRRRLGGAVRPLGEPVEDIDLALEPTSVQLAAAEVARRLAGHGDEASFGRDVVALLCEQFGCGRVGLWLRRAGGELALAAERGGGGGPGREGEPLSRRELTVGGEVVGRLEADLSPTMQEPGSLFDVAVPWIAVMARGHLSRSAPAARSGRARAAAASWGLTGRQGQVLELVCGGLCNKEIARVLGTSVKTVEVHVSQVLRRAAATSRTEVIARALGDGGSAPGRGAAG